MRVRANQAVVDLLARIAARLDATAAQVALAWLLAQQPWLAPIPGTRKLARLEENLAAADLELATSDIDEITTVSANIVVEGARYGEDTGKAGRPLSLRTTAQCGGWRGSMRSARTRGVSKMPAITSGGTSTTVSATDPAPIAKPAGTAPMSARSTTADQ